MSLQPQGILKPAVADLAEHVAQEIAQSPIGPERARLNRIYMNLNPAAKARCDALASWLVLAIQDTQI